VTYQIAHRPFTTRVSTDFYVAKFKISYKMVCYGQSPDHNASREMSEAESFDSAGSIRCLVFWAVAIEARLGGKSPEILLRYDIKRPENRHSETPIARG
jgi:hypothetical protein